MHIHGNSMNVQAANFYSAAQGAREAAAERAAKVRKNLLKRAAEAEGATSPEESFLIDQWMDSRHSQISGEEQRHAEASNNNSDFS
jgi:hypothetical protein